MMKIATLRISIILCVILAVVSCQKEYSTENGGFSGTAQGELVDSLGNCKTATIRGTYKVDTPLVTTTNYALINVNFTAAGKYKIYTDTVNGMWFLDSGFAVSTGAAVIKLKGYGTPILPKTSSFALYFRNTTCGFSVTVTGSGGTTGGGGGGTGGGGTGSNGDYFPTTSGSSWVYEYIPKLGVIDTFTVGVVTGLVTIDSLDYARFGTRLLDTFYFAKKSGNYYTTSTVDFDYTFAFDSIPNKFITYPFLKESAVVGDTWQTADYGTVKLITGTTAEYGDAKAVFTVISKNTQPYTIGGTTYQNVINMKRDLMFRPTGGTYRLVLSGNSYYAKNFGLIDQVFIGISQSVSLYKNPVIK